jgi:hypothetical protein
MISLLSFIKMMITMIFIMENLSNQLLKTFQTQMTREMTKKLEFSQKRKIEANLEDIEKKALIFILHSMWKILLLIYAIDIEGPRITLI